MDKIIQDAKNEFAKVAQHFMDKHGMLVSDVHFNYAVFTPICGAESHKVSGVVVTYQDCSHPVKAKLVGDSELINEICKLRQDVARLRNEAASQNLNDAIDYVNAKSVFDAVRKLREEIAELKNQFVSANRKLDLWEMTGMPDTRA